MEGVGAGRSTVGSKPVKTGPDGGMGGNGWGRGGGRWVGREGAAGGVAISCGVRVGRLDGDRVRRDTWGLRVVLEPFSQSR